MVHRAELCRVGKPLSKLLILDLCLCLKTFDPFRVYGDLLAFKTSKDCVERCIHISHNRSGNRHVNVYFLSFHVELDEFDVRIPFSASERKHPVEACADHNHHIGLLHNCGTAGKRAQRTFVGQYALGHRHRKIRDSVCFNELLQTIFGSCVSRAFAYEHRRAFCGGDDVGGAFNRLLVGNHCRIYVHRRIEKLFRFGCIHDFSKCRSGHVYVDTARTA